jgi:hypothetical protein
MWLRHRPETFSAAFPVIIWAVVFVAALAPVSRAQVSVLTHHNDLSRTGQNLDETYLTPANVNNQQFGQLFVQPLDGYADAEPLYVPNLQINGVTHNVVYVVTLHDGVYAFDADSNAGSNASPLWYTSLIDPPGITTVPVADQGCDGHGFLEMGILGTPVIDPTTNTMYLVDKTLQNGTYEFWLHALNILTGQESFGGPVRIQASYTTSAGELVTFEEQHRMNRPALLEYNGIIYIGFGTTGCKAYPPSTGWFMAYSASTLQQLAVLNVGPTRPSTPGLWMGGDGPPVDSGGNVYIATGEGDFDFESGGLDYGDTLMKLDIENGQFNLVDYFTPYNQAELWEQDLDLGSGGLLLLPTQAGPYPNMGVIAGKQGIIYLVNQDALGEYNPVADQVVQEVNFDPNEIINLAGGTAYWNQNIYFGGTGPTGGAIPIQMYTLSDGLLSESPTATTANGYIIYSLFSISANGANNGILWGVAVTPKVASSILYAFNASNMQQLYGSPPFDLTLHYVTPMIANGKVYITTKGSLIVMGLYNPTQVTGGNKQKGEPGTTLAEPLTVEVLNGYTGAVMPGVTINFSDGGHGGSFSNPSPVTNSEGVATTTYTLPPNPGTYHLTASYPGYITADFAETATNPTNIASTNIASH